MKINLRHLTISALPLALLTFGGQAQAASTDVILNLEGNPTCSSLGDNDAVLEFRDGDPTGGQLNLAIPGGSQTVDYSVYSSGGVLNVDWEITSVSGGLSNVRPINYIILKSQGGSGARVFHYGAAEDGDGALADTELASRSNRLGAVSFCYGLTVGFTQPPGPEVEPPIADCQDFANQMGDIEIDGTIIGRCPTDITEERLLISLDLRADNFDVQSCTCNVPQGLPVCDPELAVDEEPAAGEPGPCIVTSNMDPLEGVNERVPVLIQGVETPNSYICYTIGGRRVCYGHF